MGESRRTSSEKLIALKNGIAFLNPEPIARGSFGQIYVGKIGNPVSLLAERVVHGEESPKWLGLDDVPYQEPSADDPKPLPRPLGDPALRRRVYEAATRLWNEYVTRSKQDARKAAEEYRDLLSLIDPLLLLQDRKIAVKVLVPPAEGTGEGDVRVAEDSVRRFIKENDILRGLQHPGIVRRFGLVEDPSMGWCLLLEYIPGETLDDHLAKYDGRRMPLPSAAQRIKDVAEAIQYVHSHGVIHRDLKPANVMIREDNGKAVIMDFGIGRWSNESKTEQLTIPGSRVGTPRYMAPEQVAGEGAMTPAVDLYQLSTIFFEMITGRPAYDDMDHTAIFSWLADRTSRHPAYVADFLPGLSRDLETLIEVGRDKMPENRWTVEEFLEKLGEIVSGGKYLDLGPRPALTPTELRQALVRTRMRKKESTWEEHLLETRLHYVNFKGRIDEVRRRLAQGEHDEAQAEILQLGREAHGLPARYDALKIEVEALSKEVETAAARLESARLLSLAEEEFERQRYPEVGARLDGVAQRLAKLAGPAHDGLLQRYKKLDDLYESHRSYVELFNTLRKSFVLKIGERCDEFRREARAGRAPDGSRVREFLEQVTIAENNLKIIDRDKIGSDAYEATKRDLEVHRETLERFLGRG